MSIYFLISWFIFGFLGVCGFIYMEYYIPKKKIKIEDLFVFLAFSFAGYFASIIALTILIKFGHIKIRYNFNKTIWDFDKSYKFEKNGKRKVM